MDDRRHAYDFAIRTTPEALWAALTDPKQTRRYWYEAVLLDRATGLDVRGDGFDLVDATRPRVVRQFPRGAFDRHFLAAIAREAALRPTCQSARLLHQTGLAEWMARSPWVTEAGGD